jgi:hypothetical protein
VSILTASMLSPATSSAKADVTPGV